MCVGHGVHFVSYTQLIFIDCLAWAGVEKEQRSDVGSSIYYLHSNSKEIANRPFRAFSRRAVDSFIFLIHFLSRNGYKYTSLGVEMKRSRDFGNKSSRTVYCNGLSFNLHSRKVNWKLGVYRKRGKRDTEDDSSFSFCLFRSGIEAAGSSYLGLHLNTITL